MSDADTRPAYALLLGLAAAVLAYNAHVLSGAHPLAYAILPAASLAGHFLLDSWRNESGRERIEPLLNYGLVVAFSWVLFGLVFARSAWVGQFAGLAAAGLMMPALLDWLMERSTLKGAAPDAGEPAEA